MKVLLVLSAVVLATQAFHHIGCFRDNHNRAIAGGIRFRGSVAQCEKYARDHHWQNFAVQYGGECFTGPHAHDTYAKYGHAGNCKDGKGGGWANDVYEVDGWHQYYLQHFLRFHQAAMRRAQEIKTAHAQFVRYQSLATAQKKRYDASVHNYNAAVRTVSKYLNLRNQRAAQANRELNLYNAYVRSRNAQIKRINAVRSSCAKNVNNLVAAANKMAASQRAHHANYIRYRNSSNAYKRSYDSARRTMTARLNSRNAAFKTYSTYNNKRNAAAKQYNKLRG